MKNNKRLKRKRKLYAEQKRKEWYHINRNKVVIENDGANITFTNYWQTPNGIKGFMYLSFMNDTFRFLIPDKLLPFVPYFKESVCTISRGSGSGTNDILYEVKFGKNICLCVDSWQTDGTQDISLVQKYYTISVWNRKCEKLLEKECVFQEALTIPTAIDEDGTDEIDILVLEE